MQMTNTVWDVKHNCLKVTELIVGYPISTVFRREIW